MIRANKLATVNPRVVTGTPLDSILNRLGGTVYTNCFTPAPDTPRGIASFLTGLPPLLNGCDNRVKWPRHYLQKDLPTIFDLFLQKDYSLNIFSNPNERETGLFPEHITNLDVHNKDFELENYLKRIKLNDNHLVFVGLPDFHWAIDDFGNTTFGEKRAYGQISDTVDLVLSSFEPNAFDHIYIFSDHGYKLAHELYKVPDFHRLNDDRTRILMFHHKAGIANTVSTNSKLCSIMDLYYSLEGHLNGIPMNLSLSSSVAREWIAIEDHVKFEPSVNQDIALWAIVTQEHYYIRDLKSGYLQVKGDKFKECVVDEYDKLLLENTSYREYHDKYQRLIKYQKLIFKQNDFMNGTVRQKTTKLKIQSQALYDLIISKWVE